MQIIENYSGLPGNKPCAVALGNFDGLHIGHKKLIDEILYDACRYDMTSCVWSFKKHPENILKGSFVSKSITIMAEKAELLAQAGVSLFCLEDFENVRDFSPDEFIQKIIIEKLNAKAVVCGFNFRFGKNGAGDARYLEKVLKQNNIKLTVIAPVIYGDILVSSTYIRYLLEQGDMENAALFLGRQFFINFPVIHGKKLGTKIGVPTINQSFPPEHVIPKKGVYAVSLEIDGAPYIGVCNVGVRPTVKSDGSVNCETHIINFSGELYGQKIKVKFYKRLRDEICFSSLDELSAQVKKDIQSTRDYFNLYYN